MTIHEIIGRKIVETYHENRKYPRFYIPNLVLFINKEIISVEDVSSGGLLINKSFPINSEISGSMVYKDKKIPFKGLVKHSFKNKSGIELNLDSNITLFIDSILNPDQIVKDFILINQKNHEILWHKTDRGSLFFFNNLNSQKVFKVTYVFFNNVIHWEKNVGFKTGKTDASALKGYPFWTVDIHPEWVKINQLTKAIEHANMPKSFKLWLLEEIELSIK